MVHRWTIVTILFASTLSIEAQTPAARPAQAPPPATRPAAGIPRMPDGKPNLTGLWQSLSTANWDIRDHSAQAGAFFQLGATGAMPAGQGIVEGGDIPYKPEAAAKQKENLKNRLQL